MKKLFKFTLEKHNSPKKIPKVLLKNDKFCWKKPHDLHMWATGTVTITFESYTFVKTQMSCRKEATSVRLVILIKPGTGGINNGMNTGANW